jgi:molybdopterin-guanine dinucleotide biosynthesis protein A
MRCYHSQMCELGTAGFVLAGGQSRRMGTDKALLPYKSGTLLSHVAAQVAAAAGSVFIISPAGRYDGLQLPVVQDAYPGFGPVGGIVTALRQGHALNLITACDLPGLDCTLLLELLDSARTHHSEVDAIIPSYEGSSQPLCGVYLRSALPRFEQAVAEGMHRLQSVIAEIRTAFIEVSHDNWFVNVNTPDDWASVRR